MTERKALAFHLCSDYAIRMAKAKRQYVCQNCGSVSYRWQGQCADCGEWNTLVEEASETVFSAKHDLSKGGRSLALETLGEHSPMPERMLCGIAEFDRALGGGFVAGSRLGLGDAPVALASATSVRDILATLDSRDADFVVIDSIQTMHSDLIDSAPGTVSQVRASAQELIRYAKDGGAAIVLVGHVTKDGTIAGPRVLEHMVDTVLAFEGERSHQYRILRAVKNRFGGTDEIGVFAMGEEGLGEVANPSSLFLTDRSRDVPGSVVFPALEGTRPVLVEVQALTVRLASGATPRRAVVGWDSGRLAMVLAVLEARCGLQMGGAEVYLNIAGGYRLTDPAADLAVAAALISAFSERPVPADAIVFGELSLSGEIRPVAHDALRLREAAKLGFSRGWGPKGMKAVNGIGVTGFTRLGELVDLMLGRD